MSQKTFDDSESVLEPEISTREPLTSPNKVKPRSRAALEVYDRIQAEKLIDDDPLFESNTTY